MQLHLTTNQKRFMANKNGNIFLLSFDSSLIVNFLQIHKGWFCVIIYPPHLEYLCHVHNPTCIVTSSSCNHLLLNTFY
jgi:hypothetical protein